MIRKHQIWYVLLLGLVGSMGIGVVGSMLVVNSLIAPTLCTVPPPPPQFHLESVEFFTSAGTVVRGWYGDAGHAEACILLLHGAHGHRGDMLSRAEFLLQHGYAVLLFDFQAHGESPGDALTFGYREASNVEAAVAFIRSRTPGRKLGMIGFSLGGVATVLSSVVQEFDVLILEAVFPTIEQALANRLRMRFGAPGVWLTPLLIWQIQWRLHVTPEQLAPLAVLQRATCPILIVGGIEDQHTRQEDTEALFAAASAPKELWLIPGVHHENFHHAVPAEYEQRILTFLDHALSP